MLWGNVMLFDNLDQEGVIRVKKIFITGIPLEFKNNAD